MAELAEEPGSAAVLEVSSQTRVEQESEQPPASSKDTVAEQNAAEGDDWQETEQGRVSKLECFTCGILRRRWRAKASKTPRLEFADDAQPPKQEKEEKQSQANGGSTSPQGTEEETTLKSPDEDTPSNKQEITDTQNARETEEEATEVTERETEVQGNDIQEKTEAEEEEKHQEKDVDKQDN